MVIIKANWPALANAASAGQPPSSPTIRMRMPTAAIPSAQASTLPLGDGVRKPARWACQARAIRPTTSARVPTTARGARAGDRVAR
jgi:hypothetical protein